MTEGFDLPLLILRPEPGASATAERARERGWSVAVMPIFKVAPRDWRPPDPADFDAIMLTSANTCRHGGRNLANLRTLPAYCVGKATANAARDFGFEKIAIGKSGVGKLVDQLHAEGRKHVLHLAGEDVHGFDAQDLSVTHIAVYASEAIIPDDIDEYLAGPVIALIHSARAGEHFGSLVERAWVHRDSIQIAAISPPALSAAGGGWQRAMVASQPDDDALLDVAAILANA